MLSAGVGWVVGYAWRNDVLPGALSQWRIPGWLVGVESQKHREGFEGLRRRLEGETAEGSATGAQGSEAGRRRPMGRQLLDQFRGAF